MNLSNPRNGYKPVRAAMNNAWVASGMPSAMGSLRYVSELLSLRCAPDLLGAGLFPAKAAAKEITESMAAYQAVRGHIRWAALGGRDTVLVVVGDGSTPRTAAMFACRTAWQCHSVDPNLSGRAYRFDRLTLHRARAEDVAIKARQAVVVAVHSHASFEAAIGCVREAERIAYVAIPCCYATTLAPWAPDEAYEDKGILSPDRRVLVWHDVAGRTA